MNESYLSELKRAVEHGFVYLDLNLWIFYKERPEEIEVIYIPEYLK